MLFSPYTSISDLSNIFVNSEGMEKLLEFSDSEDDLSLPEADEKPKAF